MPRARQRREGYEQAGCARARIFVIEACRTPLFHRQRGDHFAQKLHGQLVEADDGTPFVIRQAVEVQDIFEPCQILARYLADAPLLL